MNITEVKTDILGQACWYWEVEFTDKFGCNRKLQSPIRFNPGIPDDIKAEMERAVLDLKAPPYYILT